MSTGSDTADDVKVKNESAREIISTQYDDFVLQDVDLSKIHYLTGPVAIEGAMHVFSPTKSRN